MCSVVVVAKVVLGADEVRCATCKRIGETGEAVAGAAESIKDAAVHAAKRVIDPGKEAVVGMMMSCFHCLLFVVCCTHNLESADPSKWNSSSFLFLLLKKNRNDSHREGRS